MAVAPEYLLALDYGEKRVGVAIAHMVARLPRPLTTIANDDQLIKNISQLVRNEAVGLVVVGLPRGMDGGYTEQTRTAESFQRKLSEQLTVPVVSADETLSSVDAEATLRGVAYDRAQVDAVAASHILERYIAEQSRKEPHV